MARWSWLLVGCLGCQATLPQVAVAPADAAVRGDDADWETETLEDDALTFTADQAEFQMSLAAAMLERGQEAEAATHLAQYVAQRPEHLVARAQLAELLFRQEKHDDSRSQFEQFVTKAQEHSSDAGRYLIHSHTRLVEIAEKEANTYDEHLNRGIGLYLLSSYRGNETHREDVPPPDALLCRAAFELQQARSEKPDAARPNWYLYRIWSHLGQRAAALRALAAAEKQALFDGLTPVERRELQVACLREGDLTVHAD